MLIGVNKYAETLKKLIDPETFNCQANSHLQGVPVASAKHKGVAIK